MKLFALTVLSIVALVTMSYRRGEASQQPTATTTFYTNPASTTPQGNGRKATIEYEQPAPLKDRPEQILRRTGYTTSYNLSLAYCSNFWQR